MTRYVIIGAGAVGVTLAAELQQAGREVVLVGRGAQLELLRAGQARYVTPDGEQTVEVPAAAGPHEVKLDRGDILVLATKTQQADETLAEWARQPVGDGQRLAGEVLPVFTLQNGLQAERSALRRFAHVIGSVVWVPANYVADGEVLLPAGPARGVFWVGEYPDGPASAAAQLIAADLAQANFEAQVVNDLSRWKAAKLLASATFALEALYPSGPARERAARLVAAEARAVLVSTGHPPADSQAEATVALERFKVAPIPGRPTPHTSTWQSLTRGRTPETDFLNGEIVLLARRHGRRAPISAALLARVHRAVQDGTAPGSLPEADLAQLLAQATVLVDAETLKGELSACAAAGRAGRALGPG